MFSACNAKHEGRVGGWGCPQGQVSQREGKRYRDTVRGWVRESLRPRCADPLGMFEK